MLIQSSKVLKVVSKEAQKLRDVKTIKIYSLLYIKKLVAKYSLQRFC
jgi:hypothetical protein